MLLVCFFIPLYASSLMCWSCGSYGCTENGLAVRSWGLLLRQCIKRQTDVLIDVALIGYFALLCTISSIIQQIYNYEYGPSRSPFETPEGRGGGAFAEEPTELIGNADYGTTLCGPSYATSSHTLKTPM